MIQSSPFTEIWRYQSCLCTMFMLMLVLVITQLTMNQNTLNLTSLLYNNLLQTIYTQRKETLQAVTMDPGIALVTTDSNLS